MNRARFSALAHSRHVFCNPIGEATVDRFLDAMALDAGDRVLDVGCGPAEMLIRLIERRGVRGVGVDPNPWFIDVARARARDRVPPDALELHEGTIAEYPDGGAFAAALCVGATYAYGSYGEALRALPHRVRPGGMLLIGEGYWKREPDPEYLATIGATREESDTHEGNLAQATLAGLEPVAAEVASDEDWERYETLYAESAERHLAEHPGDPDADEMRSHIRRWNDAYRRWGRNTMGFALYLFRVPR